MKIFFKTFSIIFFGLLPAQQAFSQSPINPGTLLVDQQIEGRIQGALDFNNYFPSSDVDVKVRNGTVTLSGEVPAKIDRVFAEKVAAKLGGAAIVVNNIRVNEKLVPRSRSDLEQYVSDQSLSGKIATLIAASKSAHDIKLELEVKNGIAYLRGSVRDAATRKRAGEIASLVYGIRSVNNSLQIADPSLEKEVESPENTLETNEIEISDAWITDKVKCLLDYSFAFAGNDLLIITKNGAVELKGSIRDASQKHLIEEQAIDILGVKEVSFKLNSQL